MYWCFVPVEELVMLFGEEGNVAAGATYIGVSRLVFSLRVPRLVGTL